MRAIGAIGILTITVGLSLSRPRVGTVRVQPALAAILGAVLTLVGGLLSPGQVWEVLAFLSMPVLTIVSLMVITLVAARAGFFRLLAWRLAAGARGDARKLFRHLFIAGTLTGTVFTNDAAVLIFTPMIWGLVQEIREPDWTRENCIPFYFTVLYVANLVGALVISNPINIIVADWFDIGFVAYAKWMVLPAVTSMVVSYIGLFLFFREDLPRTYRMPEPVEPVDGAERFRTLTAALLIVTLLGFFSEPWLEIPTGVVAAAGASVLLLAHRRAGAGRTRDVFAEVGWGAVIFVVGIFIVANGLREVGLTDALGSALGWSAGLGQQTANAVTGLSAALFSSVLNNHPTAGIMALAIGDLPVDASMQRGMAFAALIGGDLGPKMLPIGSLAALLWFRILRSRGVHVSYGQYIRLGLPVTLAATVCALAVLGVEYALFG